MLNLALKQSVFSHDLSTHRPKVAVVLNANARSVGASTISDIRRLLVDETLYISQSLDQSKFIARQIVNRGFDVVLSGGGDGTFTRVVTDVMALRPQNPPAFGLLRLGTGNALADALGAAPSGLKGFAADLRQSRDPDARICLPMLRVEGRLAPFAGVGLDSLILEDYNAVKDELKRMPLLRALSEGHAGYSLAIATRTVWRYLLEARPQVTIRNEGAPAQPIDLAGMPTGAPIPRGEILYRGPVSLAATSTVPFYGLGARIFPQACLHPERFQLRVADIPLIHMLAHLPKLLSGELDHERLYDFTCTAVSFSMDKPSPFQIGGDLVGSRRQVRIGMRTLEGVPGSKGVAAAPAPAHAPIAIAARG